MKKVTFVENPKKILNAIQRVEKINQPQKNNRKNSRHYSNKTELNLLTNEYFQKKNQIDVNSQAIDINSQALQTLSDAALNIKNLLSDFLTNADFQEKETFNIESELEKIKKKDLKNSINFYTLIGGNDSDRNSNISSIKRNFVIENEDNIKEESVTKKRRKDFKKQISSLTEKYYIKTKNSISKKRSHKKDFQSDNNLINCLKPKIKNTHQKNKILDRPSIKSENLKNYIKRIKSSKCQKRTSLNNSFKSVKNDEECSFKSYNPNVLENEHSILNNKSLKKNKKDKHKSSFNLGIPIHDNNESENIKKSFKRNNTLYASRNRFRRSVNDQSDIRNFIHLSRKDLQKFNDLCEGLKKNIIITKEKNETEILKKNDNPIVDIEKEKEFKEELGYLSIKKNDSINGTQIMNDGFSMKELHFRRLIKQNKYVYDSLSDEELLDDIEGEYYINPEGAFLFFHDMVIFILSIYSIIVPPIDFAFKVYKILDFYSKSVLMDFFIDFFYIIDLFIGFFTAYFDFDEKLITNNKLIIMNYLKTWFPINLVSAIPINSVFLIIDYNKNQNSIIYSNI